MRITVIGAGYVGLVSGACFSEVGFNVVCVDQDQDKLDRLNAGESTIFEPGLEELIKRNMQAGRLSFTSALGDAVSQADIVFIAVGTPTREDDGSADITFVESAAAQIAGHLRSFTVIVIKSTVPVGTARQIEKLIRKTNPTADFEIASNPEFLREGSAVEDFMQPDRIVIGTSSKRAREYLQLIYKPLSYRDTQILFSSLESSELTKYAANAFLAMKVTYINQISDLCETVGADVQDVARGMGLDDRIGSKFLKPGPGIGGSCFPKDTQALTAFAQQVGKPISLINTVVIANNIRKIAMADRINDVMGGNLAGRKIGVLGVSFKPDTNDMREAPALEIIPRLQNFGAHIAAYDPAAMDEARALLPGTEWCHDPYQAADQADALVILTEWNEFRALDLHKIARILNSPLLIDLRGIYSAEEVSDTGLIYHSIGRPTIVPKTLEAVKSAAI